MLAHSKSFPQGDFLIYNDRPDNMDLIHIHQTHSNTITLYKGEDLQDVEADGIIANYDDLKGKSLAIKTADCLPILLLGNKSAALLHAGWRGLENKIIANKLIQGISPHSTYIGPCISVDNFEVQENFKENFTGSPHFITRNGKLFFDLTSEAKMQIENLYPKCRIEISNKCTYNSLNLNSYRLDKTKKRNWNIFKRN